MPSILLCPQRKITGSHEESGCCRLSTFMVAFFTVAFEQLQKKKITTMTVSLISLGIKRDCPELVDQEFASERSTVK